MKVKDELLKKSFGFALVEIIVVIGVLAIVVGTLLQLFVHVSNLSDAVRNQTLAITQLNNKVEEIRNYSYDDIVVDYASGGSVGDTFDLTDMTGKGVVSVDSSNADLLLIVVTVCWQNKSGLVIGEDQDFDGILDIGEDVDGDGVIDSPMQMSFLRARR